MHVDAGGEGDGVVEGDAEPGAKSSLGFVMARQTRDLGARSRACFSMRSVVRVLISNLLVAW